MRKSEQMDDPQSRFKNSVEKAKADMSGRKITNFQRFASNPLAK